MNKLGLLTLSAWAAPRLFRARRRTWGLLGMGLLALLGVLLWAVVALVGWFLAQLQGWSTAAPEAARGVLATVGHQVEQALPGVRDKVATELVEWVPMLKPGERPQRDVSGTEFAPVARYPGLVRTFWHREGRQVTVHYEGPANYLAVLGHYRQGFIALGYTQALLSASPQAETHEWILGARRFHTKIVGEPAGGVSVQIETTLQ